MDARIEQLVFNDIAKDLQKHLNKPMTLKEYRSLVDRYAADSVRKHGLNTSLSTSLSKKFDNFIDIKKYESKSNNLFDNLKYNSNIKEYFTFEIKTDQLQKYSKIQQQMQQQQQKQKLQSKPEAKKKQEPEVSVSNIAKTIAANDLGREL